MSAARPKPSMRAVAVSLALHVAAVGLARLAPPPRPVAPAPAPAAPAVDLSFEEPPTPAAPAPSPAAEPAPQPPAPTTRAERPARGELPRPTSGPRGAEVVAPSPPAPAVGPAPAPTTPPAPPVISANEVLRNSNRAAFDAWSRGAVVLTAVGDGHNARDLIAAPPGSAEERVHRASAGYVRDQLAATHQHEAPGVRGYFWSLRRRMLETWRPGVAREPSMLDALVAGVAMPAEAMRDVLRAAAGAASEPGRQGAAADALDGHRGNDPTARNVTPFTGIVDASRGTTQRTRAEVEVVQDAQGNVVSVRIARSARVAGFDEAALRAVRDALPLQAPVAMPGGRRSRWSFEVIASRDPIVPGVGFEFDESSGWFELHYPGRLHLRSRVWLENASPVGG